MNKKIKTLLLIGSGIFLSACTGGGDAAISSSSGAPLIPAANDTSGNYHCQSKDTARYGEYLVENNDWNIGNVTSHAQCVKIGPNIDGGVDVGWTWTWPAGSDGGVVIRSYPEVIYGQKPWFANSSTSSLPRVANSLNQALVSFTTATNPGSNGVANLAFDIWLTSSNQIPSGQYYLPLHTELMIWLGSWGGLAPAGSKIATVAIGDRSWDLYQTTATWGPSPWQYIAYVPTTPVPAAYSLDVKLFIDDLKSRQLITGQEWLASIEFGNELAFGTGTAAIQNFKVQIQ